MAATDHDLKTQAAMKRGLAPFALAVHLSHEEAFWRDAAEVATDPRIAEWESSAGWDVRFEPPYGDPAAELASRYWRGRNGRRIVAVFLRAAGSALAARDGDRVLASAALGALSGAVWDVGAPLADGEARYMPRAGYYDLVWDGARAVVCRRAKSCAECQRDLASDRGGRERPLLCSPCDASNRRLGGYYTYAASRTLKHCSYLLAYDPIDLG